MAEGEYPGKTWGEESSGEEDMGQRQWMRGQPVGCATRWVRRGLCRPPGHSRETELPYRSCGVVHALSSVIGKAVVRFQAWLREYSLLSTF